MKTFEEYRSELGASHLIMSGNCCRHAFNAGQQSLQAENNAMQKRINEVLDILRNPNDTWDQTAIDCIDILRSEDEN